MQRPPESYDPFDGTETVYVDGEPVPAKVDDAYMLLTFEQDEKLYTLTSKDDLGSLAYLYERIVTTTA
jgi:hypothetical protein